MAAVISILRKSDVEARTGLSGSSIDRLEANGQFPARIQLSPSTVGWYSAEVDDWIFSRQRVSADAQASELEDLRTPVLTGGPAKDPEVEAHRQKRLKAFKDKWEKKDEEKKDEEKKDEEKKGNKNV